MAIYSDTFTDEIVRRITDGAIGVIRTDTLYGIVARADNQQSVERLYKAKQRTPSKSPIVLISSTKQLFDVYSEATLAALDEFWPGKNSIILLSTQAPAWITRGNSSVAYRLPGNEALRAVLSQTGPLIAPSANPEGLPPARTIDEAKAYFGDEVDFYVNGGVVSDDAPSRLYRFNESTFERLR